MDYQAESIQKIWHMNGKCYSVYVNGQTTKYLCYVLVTTQAVIETRVCDTGINNVIINIKNYTEECNKRLMLKISKETFEIKFDRMIQRLMYAIKNHLC